jgi:hypothetical protein
MTIGEARYVLAHREIYDQATYMWAVEIVENYERQHPNECN